jgi:hypothetical protein
MLEYIGTVYGIRLSDAIDEHVFIDKSLNVLKFLIKKNKQRYCYITEKI